MNWFNWLLFKLTDQSGKVGEDDPPPTDPPAIDPPADPAADPPADPPPPQYASVSDVNQIKESQQSLNDTLQRLQGTIEALNSRPESPSAPTTPSIEDVSDETLDASLNDGKGAAHFRKAWKADMLRMKSDLDAQIAQLQNFGITALSEHGEQLAETQMPYRNNARVKNLIETELAKARKSNPELLSSPRIVQSIHDRVVGNNVGVIVQDAVDEALRKAREPVNPNLPPGRPGRTPQAPGSEGDIPTVEEYLGKEAAQALSFKGQSPDDYAKGLRRGLKNWGEFVKWDMTEKEKQTGNTSGRA